MRCSEGLQHTYRCQNLLRIKGTFNKIGKILDSQFDKIDEKLDGQFDKINVKLDGQFDKINVKLDTSAGA